MNDLWRRNGTRWIGASVLLVGFLSWVIFTQADDSLVIPVGATCPGALAKPSNDQPSGAAYEDQASRAEAAAELRQDAIDLTQSSLESGLAKDEVNVTVSFLSRQSAEGTLKLAEAEGLTIHTLRHGLLIGNNYFNGEVSAQDPKGTYLETKQIEKDFGEKLSLLVEDAVGLAAGSDDDAANEILSALKDRQADFEKGGIPVVGLTGQGALGDAREFASSHPDYLVGASALECDPLPVVLPADSLDAITADPRQESVPPEDSFPAPSREESPA